MTHLNNKQLDWLIRWRDYFENHGSSYYDVKLPGGFTKVNGYNMYEYLKVIIEQGTYEDKDKKWLNALKVLKQNGINV